MTQAMQTHDFLAHHGVKGMKWGVRKNYQELRNRPMETIKLTTEKGASVTLKETRSPAILDAIAAAFPNSKYHKFMSSSRGFDIEVGGKQVGSTAFREKSKDELNLSWVGVDKKHRGQGYASTVFDAGVAYAKSKGYKQITLEVPGNAPDARHIYEKRGFKQAGPMEGHKGDIWGGLTPMALDISGTELRHASADVTPEEMELALIQHMTALGIDDIVFPTEVKGSKMAHAMETEDFLEHFGVKGMKWGVIRSKEQRQANRSARADTKIAVRATQAKGIDTTDAGIKKARQSLPDAQRRAADAKDRYKVDKHTMNKIDAKRPLKVAVADLKRIQANADHLTKDEQFAHDMMQAGRAVVDVFSKPENRRSEMQKIVDSHHDKQRVRAASGA